MLGATVRGMLLLVAAGGIFSAGIGVGMLFDNSELPRRDERPGMIAEKSSRIGKVDVPAAKTRIPPATPTVVAPEPLPVVRTPVQPPTKPVSMPRPPPPDGAWRDNAIAYTATPGAPLIAIVLDDMGLDRHRSERAARLEGPLTLAYLSYADDLLAQTGAARARGHELLLHLPMEPEGENDPGPGALLLRLGDAEIRERIDFALGRFPDFIGVNNHMGSRFTADPRRMRMVFEALRPSGHLFLDSLTTPRAISMELGREMQVPTLARDVFLDDINTQDEVWFRLLQAEQIAEKTGTAIAIGHPRDATLAVLEDWIAELQHRSARLAPLSAVARVRLERHHQVMVKP